MVCLVGGLKQVHSQPETHSGCECTCLRPPTTLRCDPALTLAYDIDYQTGCCLYASHVLPSPSEMVQVTLNKRWMREPVCIMESRTYSLPYVVDYTFLYAQLLLQLLLIRKLFHSVACCIIAKFILLHPIGLHWRNCAFDNKIRPTKINGLLQALGL